MLLPFLGQFAWPWPESSTCRVVDNDRHGHGNVSTSASAHSALPACRPRLGVHVPVAQCCSQTYGPPEADGDVLEVGVVIAPRVGGPGAVCAHVR